MTNPTETAPDHTAQPLHVVLGGSGAAGSALVRELARQGRRVWAVSRRPLAALPAGAEWRPANVNDPASVAAVTQGADIVYHAAQPEYTRWAQDFPAMNRAVLEGVSRSGAKLVFVDNLYMYGPVNGPISETSAQHPTSKKGRVRLELARQLLAAHEAGQLRVVIARSSDYYGPWVEGSFVGEALFKAVAAGKRAPLIGSADQPHSFTFVDDLARALVLLGEHPEAAGQVWHIPAAEPLTGRAFTRLIAEAAGVPARPPLVLPALATRAAGLAVPLLREMADIMDQYTAPFVIDGGKFARTFKFTPTPHREAVSRTLNWLRAQAADATSPEPAGRPAAR